MTTYSISNADYRRQKTALTRAINSKVPELVLAACEKVLHEWYGKAWPDDWHRWVRALEDAYYDWTRDQYSRPFAINDPEILGRFDEARETLGY